jgi:hypothetical protein
MPGMDQYRSGGDHEASGPRCSGLLVIFSSLMNQPPGGACLLDSFHSANNMKQYFWPNLLCN